MGESAPPRRIRVVHTLRYRFEEPVAGADLVLRLTPRALPDQAVLHHQILVEPLPRAVTLFEDEHGNAQQRVELGEPFRELEITAVSTVTRPEPGAGIAPEAARAALDLLARCGVHPTAPGSPEPLRGACRSQAESALGRLRAHGVPCRYVAGYPLPQRRSRALPHAWVSLHLTGHGWLDFDGTRGEVTPGHLVLGWGHGYDDVAPISGCLVAGGRFRLVSSVIVDPLVVAGGDR